MCMGEQGKGRELKAHPTFIHTLLIKNPMDCVKTNKKEKRMKKHKKNMGEKTVMGTLVKNILLKYEGRLVRAQLGWPPARGAPGRSMVSRCADCWRSRAVRSPSSARSCSWDRFGLRGGSATAARPPRHLVPQTGISWRTPGGGVQPGCNIKAGGGSDPLQGFRGLLLHPHTLLFRTLDPAGQLEKGAGWLNLLPGGEISG